MPTKTRPQVIGRVRPAPRVLAKQTMKADTPATIDRAKDVTIRALKADLKSVLDLVEEILDEHGLTSSDIEAKALMLRQRWGLS